MKYRVVFFVLSLFVCLIYNTKLIANNSNILSLEGNWDLIGFNSDKSQHVELSAKVPGYVHLDLLNEGIIKDPFWRKNADYCQWIEHWQWNYRKSFYIPEEFDINNAFLEFDGIDTYAEIYLNGRKIGKPNAPTVSNMFLKYSFNVSEMLKLGSENVLEVKFVPVKDAVGDKANSKKYPCAFGDPYRLHIRRMQCTFGWDWVYRFVSYGIWRSCRIKSYPKAYIDDLFVYTKEIIPNSASLHVEVTIKGDEKFDSKCIMRMKSPEGKVVWSNHKVISGSGNVNMDFDIESPMLWWPNGAGEQPLYTFESEILDLSGNLLNKSVKKVGIRTVELDETQDEIGSSFIIKINDKPIFCKGGNWIPADPFPSRVTSEWYNKLLVRTAEAGMNMIRVWGGGIYEDDSFYEICDSQGIMIWQDFMLACGKYPEDQPAFVNSFLGEIDYNVSRLRNHPSIVLWCGDNELGYAGNLVDFHKQKTSVLIEKIDPSRPFHPSSPTNHAPLAMNTGDAHLGFHNSFIIPFLKNNADYRKIISSYSHARFLSESTTCGVPVKSSLLKFMTNEDLSKSEIFDYHTQDNPYSKGNYSLFGGLEKVSNILYGDPVKNRNNYSETRLRQLQYCQYEFVRLVMEATRANKPITNGILFWMLNDCWPTSGWSLIDYWGIPKAAWYAMKSGCKDVIAATEDEYEGISWTIASDRQVPVLVNYKIWIQALDGSSSEIIKEGKIDIPQNASSVVLEYKDKSNLIEKVGDNKMVVFEIESESGYDRSYWTPLLPRDIKYVPTQLKVKGETSGVEGELKISSSNWARVVTITGNALFSDNYFEMLPGETKTIKWKSIDGNVIDNINISCWNQIN